MSEDQAIRSRRPGRSFFRINVKTMMILVATSSLVIWMARTIWEGSTTQSHFIRVLRSGNATDRRDASRQLIATPRSGEADRVVEALILGLRDEDAEVRAASANSLGPVVRQLLERWKTSPDALRTNQPLVSTTTRALIGLLEDSSDAVKTEALMALVVVHSHWIQGNNAPPKRLCLGLDPIDKTLPQELSTALVKALGDESPLVRGFSAWALGELGPFLFQDIPPGLVDALNDPVEGVRQRAGAACASYEQGLSPLLPDLFTRLERAQPPFRYALRVCLKEWKGTADPSLVPLLRERLKSSSPEVRECAAFMLGRMGPQAVAATPELLIVLNEPFTVEKPKRTLPDEQPDPAGAAVVALSKFLPTQEFIDALAMSLESDVPDRRDRAAIHLSTIGPAARKAVPALIAALQAQLKSDDPADESGAYSHASVAYALGKIAPDTEFADPTITVLVEALRSKNANMRVPAAEALGRFGPRAGLAIPSLKGLTNDSAFADRWRQEVRQAARKSLAAIEAASVPSGESPK